MNKRIRYDGSFGEQYEVGRYNLRQMQLYLSTRNETLSKIIKKYFAPNDTLRVLEVGCGTGLSLQHLSQSSKVKQLFGMDLSSIMLSQSAEKLEKLRRQKNIVLGSALHIPYLTGSFDCVFATRFIHQFSHDDKKRIVNEMLRVVKNDGIVVIEFYAYFFHLFRYYFGKSGRKRKGRKGFLEHYPMAKDVEDIIGEPLNRIPLRIAGSGILLRIFNEQSVRKITDKATTFPFRTFLDEYFIVKRKQ